MATAAFKGVVENGQIRLRDNVTVPEHVKVYVVVPDLETTRHAHIVSPRLAHPEQAAAFEGDRRDLDRCRAMMCGDL